MPSNPVRDPRLEPKAGDQLRKQKTRYTVLSVDDVYVNYRSAEGRYSGRSSYPRPSWPKLMGEATVIHAAE
jgi:hypothetical protein